MSFFELVLWRRIARLFERTQLKIGAAIVLLCCASSAHAGEYPFSYPPELEHDVKFWQRVYSEATTDQGLIHDAEQLDVVYEKVDLQSGWPQSKRAKFVEDAKAKYARILRKLANGSDGELTEEEQRVRELWPKSASRATLLRAAEQLRFQLGQANRFREGLVRSGRWLPQIQKIFEREGLPIELAALPHVESSFDPYARSKVGAAGLWQFMRGTGRRFLRIDSSVDERYDPYKSSAAAANFLEQNYAILGKWPLALTAYNHGPAGMRRAVEKVGTDDIAVIVRRYDSRTFGFASRNFYLAFLAALEIDAHPEKFFGPINREPPDNSQAVLLPDYMPMPSLASALGVSVEQLRRLNPALLPSVWNGSRRAPRGYELRAPPTLDLSQAFARVPGRERFAAQIADVDHAVERGDTLSTIAARYRLSQTRLAELNDLKPPYRLRAGQRLLLPPSAGGKVASSAPEPVPVLVKVAPPAVVATAEAAAGVERQYTVRRGDSLSQIARRFSLAEVELMRLNGIKERDFIYEGQVLTVAASVEPTVESAVESTAESAPSDAEISATDAVVASSESAEPASRAEAEDLGPTLVPGAQTAQSADPSDYSVRDDDTVRVEAAETLGHYADWLQVPAVKLRALNRMSRERALIVGRRVRLDFTKVDRAAFEARRAAHHQKMQDDFFAQYRIVGSETHTVRAGDSIWVIAQKKYNVPIWLLRQYNPEVDLEALQPGATIVIPKVERASGA